jgi:hypothetical protein
MRVARNISQCFEGKLEKRKRKREKEEKCAR